MIAMNYRSLANTGIQVSEIALGCWPIVDASNPAMNEADSLTTVRACFDLGINHLDTAYMYGIDGASERLIARAIAGRRDACVLATKCGVHGVPDVSETYDSRPATLRRECEESLRRLQTDHVELLYLHAADKNTPVAESAGELKRLMDEGKTRAVGASNLSLPQLQAFATACPLSAFQPPYNMLMRQIEADVLPWCRENHVSVFAYWPLMKGLFSGKFRRDQILSPDDCRNNYAMFVGEERRKNHDLVDRLQAIAEATGHTVVELVINWIANREGITAVLCGARRPDQIRGCAGASGWRLTAEQLADIDQALADRGVPDVRVP
jgi:aryl-alcohol dehydrogenase-like predicted oxidoreductase